METVAESHASLIREMTRAPKPTAHVDAAEDAEGVDPQCRCPAAPAPGSMCVPPTREKLVSTTFI
jgi:hypothetical protein